jgi:hypothetical protein
MTSERAPWRRVATRAEVAEFGLAGLRERGLLPPIGGGAIGQAGAAFFQNYPTNESYLTDQNFWTQNTEQNIAPRPAVPFTGIGGTRCDVPIPDSGLVAWMKVMFIGSLVVTTALDTTSLWPWGLFNEVTLSVNGGTDLISCSGLDMRAHRQRLFRNPVESVSAAPGTDAKCNPVAGTSIADGTYPVILAIDIPIVHDMSSLAGLLYAQSSSNEFVVSFQPEVFANLFSAGVATLTGSFYPELTFFDIPQVQGQGNQPGGPVLPAMNWLHSLQAKEQPVAGSGDQVVPLGKYAGQLLAIMDYTYSTGPGVHLNPATSYDQIRLEYGTNRKPRVWTGPTTQGALSLLDENQGDYNGLLLPAYKVIDLEKDSPQRDIIYPEGVNGLQLVNSVTAAAALPAGAKTHIVSEILYSAQ